MTKISLRIKKLKWSEKLKDRKCMHCRSCISVCPNNALYFQNINNKEILTWNQNKCSGCGKCVKVCPEQVLRFIKKKAI